MKSKLYFTHSLSDYGTQAERFMLDRILETFSGCDLVNPAGLDKEIDEDIYLSIDEYMQPFYTIIDECDVLVFMPISKAGKLGIAAFLEVRHAETNKLPVYVYNGTFFTARYRIDECHTLGGKKDYNNNWAQLTIGVGYEKGEIERNRVQAEVKSKEREFRTDVRHTDLTGVLAKLDNNELLTAVEFVAWRQYIKRLGKTGYKKW